MLPRAVARVWAACHAAYPDPLGSVLLLAVLWFAVQVPFRLTLLRERSELRARHAAQTRTFTALWQAGSKHQTEPPKQRPAAAPRSGCVSFSVRAVLWLAMLLVFLDAAAWLPVDSALLGAACGRAVRCAEPVLLGPLGVDLLGGALWQPAAALVFGAWYVVIGIRLVVRRIQRGDPVKRHYRRELALLLAMSVVKLCLPVGLLVVMESSHAVGLLAYPDPERT